MLASEYELHAEAALEAGREEVLFSEPRVLRSYRTRGVFRRGHQRLPVVRLCEVGICQVDTRSLPIVAIVKGVNQRGDLLVEQVLNIELEAKRAALAEFPDFVRDHQVSPVKERSSAQIAAPVHVNVRAPVGGVNHG